MKIAKTIIKFLGGFHQDEVLTECVKHLYNTISSKDILRIDEDGKWYLMDKPISEANKQLIISEANIFQGTMLWKVLQNDIKYQANKRMFELSKTDMDIAIGKTWLFTLDAITTRLNSLNKGKGYFNE